MTDRCPTPSEHYLTAALALYRRAGYAELPDYNGNAKANLWLERPLTDEGALRRR